MSQHKPSYLLHVWWSVDYQRANFTEIRDMSYPECINWFNYKKMVNGKAATVYCFFDDYDIRDHVLNEAATRFMKGDYMLIEVDLYHLTRKVSKGVNLIDHPR